jgi:hypothetical protein
MTASRTARAAAFLLADAVFGACSGNSTEPRTARPETTQLPEPSLEPTSPRAEPTARKSQRGNVTKEIGEIAFNYDPARGPDVRWLEFKITDLEVDGDCTDPQAEPENGHLLFVTITASTATEWPPDVINAGVTAVSFNPSDFAIVGADDLAERDLSTDATRSCLSETELLPLRIGPGEKVEGKVVLDTANSTGILVFRPVYAGGSGWEWEY